jgi:hypothetical protein
MNGYRKVVYSSSTKLVSQSRELYSLLNLPISEPTLHRLLHLRKQEVQPLHRVHGVQRTRKQKGRRGVVNPVWTMYVLLTLTWKGMVELIVRSYRRETI